MDKKLSWIVAGIIAVGIVAFGFVQIGPRPAVAQSGGWGTEVTSQYFSADGTTTTNASEFHGIVLQVTSNGGYAIAYDATNATEAISVAKIGEYILTTAKDSRPYEFAGHYIHCATGLYLDVDNAECQVLYR